MKTQTTIVIVALCLAAVFAPVAWRCWKPKPAPAASSLLARTADALRGIFGPRVTVSGSGVVTTPRDIGELALSEQDVVVDTRHERTLPLGMFAAGLDIRGTHRAKLGIDMAALGGRLDVGSQTLRLTVPRCRLLSLETVDVGRLRRDHCIINRAGPADFAAALAENLREARRQAGRAEVLADADRHLARRLADAFAPLGLRVELTAAPPAESCP